MFYCEGCRKVFVPPDEEIETVQELFGLHAARCPTCRIVRPFRKEIPERFRPPTFH